MNDPAARPAIAGELPEMDKYDTVFLGFPIWWYVEPRIVDTFMEACDVAGKAFIPFATSGGSGVEGDMLPSIQSIPVYGFLFHPTKITSWGKNVPCIG